MYDDPLAVQEPPFQVIPNPSQEQVADLAGQWRNWMANPNNRSALMQFGVSLMQPMGFGQNAAGHVGQAIGSVGEMASRRNADVLKERDLASKEELRASQANVAEARAANAGNTAGRQADRLVFEREKMGLTALLHQQRRRGDAAKLYETYRKNEEAANEVRPVAQRRPVMSPDEFKRYMGLTDVDSSDGETSLSAAASPTPSASASANAPPVSALREGTGIRFSNGQVWTLENGQPKRVR